ncbi:DUF1801 domain-containing protein [Actinoplanes sp. NPDC049316]|uniref:DUF1801 domain-containing protein n=1 Tax=Actinoplanes sp. NPDC049316 TaxID=3154727 RepID=UPI00344A3F68
MPSWPTTGLAPVMWGDSIIGFGAYRYRYASGKEADWPPVALSPRKTGLAIYLMAGFDEDLLARLGRHRTGRSCLYVRRLADVDPDVLRALVADAFRKLHGKTLTAD